jgi:hypothetical protein
MRVLDDNVTMEMTLQEQGTFFGILLTKHGYVANLIFQESLSKAEVNEDSSYTVNDWEWK